MSLPAALPALLLQRPAALLDVLPLPHLAPSWSGARFRGHPVRAQHALDAATQARVIARLQPQRWLLTGGVRSSLPVYGAQFGPAVQALDVLFSPDCFWLWLWHGGQRWQRELSRADNQALAECLHSVIALADKNRG